MGCLRVLMGQYNRSIEFGAEEVDISTSLLFQMERNGESRSAYRGYCCV